MVITQQSLGQWRDRLASGSSSEWGNSSSKNLSELRPLSSRISGSMCHPQHRLYAFKPPHLLSIEIKHQLPALTFFQRTSKHHKKTRSKNYVNLAYNSVFQLTSSCLYHDGELQLPPKRLNYLQTPTNTTYTVAHLEL